MSNIQKHETAAASIFTDGQSFEHAQRVAKMLASSDLVPEQYRGKIANTIVALNMAQRIGVDPMAVMQNLNIIHGRPSWSSAFLISAVNNSGRFSAIRYKMETDGECVFEGKKIVNSVCVAWAKDSEGEILEGPPASIKMAIGEGWYGKKGSKWPNMPDLMLRYRAAAFFVRLYAPELTMGMKTAEETMDTYTDTVDGVAEVMPSASINDRVMAQVVAPMVSPTVAVLDAVPVVSEPTPTVETKTVAVDAEAEAEADVDSWL